MTTNFDNEPFNGDTFLAARIKELVQQFAVKTIVETGTWHGVTTVELARIVGPGEVHTIEVGADAQAVAHAHWRMNCSGAPIMSYLGSSPDVLHQILPWLTRPTLYFLDAHGNDGCPLPQEIEAIAQYDEKPIIVTHDAFNPDRPEYQYDRYYGKKIGFEWLRPYLNKIKGSWDVSYNTDAAGKKIGVMFVIPRI